MNDPEIKTNICFDFKTTMAENLKALELFIELWRTLPEPKPQWLKNGTQEVAAAIVARMLIAESRIEEPKLSA